MACSNEVAHLSPFLGGGEGMAVLVEVLVPLGDDVVEGVLGLSSLPFCVPPANVGGGAEVDCGRGLPKPGSWTPALPGKVLLAGAESGAIIDESVVPDDAVPPSHKLWVICLQLPECTVNTRREMPMPMPKKNMRK